MQEKSLEAKTKKTQMLALLAKDSKTPIITVYNRRCSCHENIQKGAAEK